MNLTRREVLLGATAALAGAGLGSAQSPEIPRISAEEALRLAAKGEAVIVDVRDKLAWDGGHAEGALSIPLAEVGKRASELPKDKLIAAYCT
jgi:rhodanese-related sulfurtransferase